MHRFKMYISDSTSYNETTSPYQYVYVNNVTVAEYLYTLKGITDVLLGDTPVRYVALVLHELPIPGYTSVLMTVCEVEIYEGNC